MSPAGTALDVIVAGVAEDDQRQRRAGAVDEVVALAEVDRETRPSSGSMIS